MSGPLTKSLIYTAVPVFLATAIVWIIGVSNHTFLANEFWLYVGIFFIPAMSVCGSSWLIFHRKLWFRVAGLVTILPSIGIWIVSLLLVFNGFKIH